MSNAEKMVKFLNGCHSVFHAVALMEKQLQEDHPDLPEVETAGGETV